MSETMKFEGGGKSMISKLVRVGVVFLVILGIVGIPHATIMADTVAISVSALPSANTVHPGDNFDVHISITTNAQTRGFSFILNWDSSKVQCNSVDEGGFFKDFAAAHTGISRMVIPTPTFDNTVGRLPAGTTVNDNQGILLMGGTGVSSSPGPTGTGDAFILHMSAKTGVTGTVNFTLSNVHLLDNSTLTSTPGDLNPVVVNGQVNISSTAQSPPTITSFSPTSAGMGTDVTVSGTNLTGATVKFGGITANVKTNTDTQIVATVGGGATGKVNVTTVGGTIDSANNFTFVAAPIITSFTPQIAGQGNQVTITGTNLSNATAVKFGGTAATISSNTGAQIVATVGIGTSGDVSVTTVGGSYTQSGFVFALPPTISAFTPMTGGAGTPVTITGTNFIPGIPQVKIGGIAAGLTSYTATQIIAVVNTGATSGDVNVVTPGGSANLTGFSYVPQSPTITSFAPTSGTAGASIIITGANLTGASAVSFGGTAAQSYQVNSAAQITAVVGAGTTGTISVTTPGGTATKDGFTFTTATSATSTTSTTTSATSTTGTTTTSTTPMTSNPSATTPAASVITRPTVVSSLRTTTTPTQTSRASSLSGIGPITSLDLSDSMDNSGMLQTDFLQGNIRYNGNNQIVSLDIANGTRIVASDGSPVSNISIQAGANVPPAPSGQSIVSAVDFEPSETTFSSPIIVVFGYDPTQVSRKINANGLALEYYDSHINKWVKGDYTIDIQNHQITAKLSHFSLYAVISSNSTGLMGMGWSWAGTIIILEMLVGGLAIYYFLRRKRPLAPATARVQAAQPVMDVSTTGLSATKTTDAKESPVSWDDILPRSVKKGKPFTTHLEIIGGEIIIPTGHDSVGIKLVNNPDSRILVSLEYDPELHPHGLAKIMVLGSTGSAEYEKSKGE